MSYPFLVKLLIQLQKFLINFFTIIIKNISCNLSAYSSFALVLFGCNGKIAPPPPTGRVLNKNVPPGLGLGLWWASEGSFPGGSFPSTFSGEYNYWHYKKVCI